MNVRGDFLGPPNLHFSHMQPIVNDFQSYAKIKASKCLILSTIFSAMRQFHNIASFSNKHHAGNICTCIFTHKENIK